MGLFFVHFTMTRTNGMLPRFATGWGWLLVSMMLAVSAQAQHTGPHGSHSQDGHHHEAVVSGWEGSPEGKAYSEFNHHIAGALVVLIGLSELPQAIGLSTLAWGHFLLPAAMLAGGLFLMIWSDHDAWPIGSLSFTQTFLTGDWETVQHKLFGLLLLSVGSVEWLRRTGRLNHVGWSALLPAFAIVGGLSLFAHSHGAHPSAHKIALHHAAMGVMAVSAGSSKFLSKRKREAAAPVGAGRFTVGSRWELVWAVFVLLIGVQLLIYSE
jgi:putative copper resistance protein D